MPKKQKNTPSNTAPDKSKEMMDKGKKMVGGIFAKIKKYLAPEKVDAFQKDWLANPKDRKKYETIKDVPEIVVEEAKAMTDDVIQFLQKQEGGQSVVFKKIKNKTSEFLKNPAEFAQKKAEKTLDTAKKTVKEVTKAPVKKVKKTLPKKVVKTKDQKLKD